MKLSRITGVALLIGVMLTGTALAAPQQNIKRGHASINFNYNLTQANNTKTQGAKIEANDKARPGMDVRVGVADKVALQYKYNSTKTTGINNVIVRGNDATARTQEYNAYYEILPGASVYAGVINNNLKVNGADESRNVLQVGAQYVMPLPMGLTAWANTGAGKGVLHAEAGIGYAILPNVDIDLSYRYNQFELRNGDEHRDNGIVLGLTAKL